MIEEWKSIPGYDGAYQVSNQGRVIGKHHRVMKPKFSRGYAQITCYDENHKMHTFNIHRLVAEQFIPNPDGLPQVDHINESKLDNRVENLRWCTCKQNIRHSMPKHNKIASFKERSIFMFSEQEHRYSFRSEKEAAQILGVNKQGIWCCLHGRQKTTGGMRFEFA